MGNFFKRFTTLKVKQFLKQAPGTKWELKSLARSKLKTKKPQELNQQLKLKSGIKSSVSGTKLLALMTGGDLTCFDAFKHILLRFPSLRSQTSVPKNYKMPKSFKKPAYMFIATCVCLLFQAYP